MSRASIAAATSSNEPASSVKTSAPCALRALQRVDRHSDEHGQPDASADERVDEARAVVGADERRDKDGGRPCLRDEQRAAADEHRRRHRQEHDEAELPRAGAEPQTSRSPTRMPTATPAVSSTTRRGRLETPIPSAIIAAIGAKNARGGRSRRARDTRRSRRRAPTARRAARPREPPPRARRGALAPPPGSELGQPRERPEPDPDRREQDVEEEHPGGELDPPERPAPERDLPALLRPRVRFRCSTSRMTRAAVSSIESSVVSMTGHSEPALDRGRLVELLVDLGQLGVACGSRAEPAGPLRADLGEPLRLDRQPDDLRPASISNSSFGGLMPCTIGTFAVL